MANTLNQQNQQVTTQPQTQQATTQQTNQQTASQQQNQQTNAQQTNQQAASQQQNQQATAQQQQQQQKQAGTITIPGTNIQIPTSVAAANGILNAANLQNIKVEGTGKIPKFPQIRSLIECHTIRDTRETHDPHTAASVPSQYNLSAWLSIHQIGKTKSSLAVKELMCVCVFVCRMLPSISYLCHVPAVRGSHS